MWRDIFQLIDCQSLREIDSGYGDHINEYTLHMITTKEFVDALFEFQFPTLKIISCIKTNLL